MEVDFDTYVIRVARNYGNSYRCVYCDEIFHTEDEMVQHLLRAELDGGHVTGMHIRYNLLNGMLAAARPPPTSYNEEASIGRAISEVASNSEEGDDPLCISTAEKRKAIDIELTWPRGPPFKRSRYLKNVVEESTVVAYDMKEHVPIAEEKEEDVPKVPEPSKGLLEEHVPTAEEKEEEDVLFTEEEEDDAYFMRMAFMELYHSKL